MIRSVFVGILIGWLGTNAYLYAQERRRHKAEMDRITPANIRRILEEFAIPYHRDDGTFR